MDILFLVYGLIVIFLVNIDTTNICVSAITSWLFGFGIILLIKEVKKYESRNSKRN